MRGCPAFITVLAFFIILCLGTAASHAAPTVEQYRPLDDLDYHYQEARAYFQLLKESPNIGNSRENWIKGAGHFRRIYLAEPKSRLAPSCLYMLGRMYDEMYNRFNQGIDLGEALSYYRDVDSLFPGNRLADDALFAVGIILLEKVKDPKRAAETFRKIVIEYPSGDMTPHAATRLKNLSQEYNIPLPEVMVGTDHQKKLTNVLPVKYWSSNDYTRVVINTSGPVTYREELLESNNKTPRRLYIDFHNSYIAPRFRSPIPIEDGLLKRIRTGQFSPDTVRVVLDIESLSDYKIFSLRDPFRVVIDVRGEQRPNGNRQPSQTAKRGQVPQTTTAAVSDAKVKHPADIPPDNTPVPVPPDAKTDTPASPQQSRADDAETWQAHQHADATVVLRASKKIAINTQLKTVTAETENYSSNAAPEPVQEPVPVAESGQQDTARTAPEQEQRFSIAQQLGLQVDTIVIDPGHGGKDPGAIAYGMKEKDIVLRVARELAMRLEKELDATVLLTRTNDTYLPLEERTAIANTNDADLFVSLHINAHPSSTVNGFETYFLNFSTNSEAMRVAARENATSSHQMSDLQDILRDIMQNAKVSESSRLAQQVHASIVSPDDAASFSLKDMGVKQAPFYVLIGAEMPAILIELAFISNPDDARNLADDLFIGQLADRISAGIQRYINANTAQL